MKWAKMFNDNTKSKLKKYILAVFTVAFLLMITACNSDPSATSGSSSTSAYNTPIPQDTIPITIEAGGKSFAANLYSNPTTTALLEHFPLEISMDDLNNNEKFYNLPFALATNSKPVDRINAGELMLYGNNCIVLFYDSFPTTYSYTPLGYVENINELKPVLGSGSLEVTFFNTAN